MSTRRIIDYAGIAALITALTTAIIALVNGFQQKSESTNLSASTFAVMDYRLRMIEQKLDLPSPSMSLMHGVGMAERRATRAKPHIPRDFESMKAVVQSTGKAWAPPVTEEDNP